MALKPISKVLKRRKARMGILLLLGLWCLSPLAGFLRQVHEHAGHAHSEIESNRIEVAATPHLICHHHPEGCPRDCYCPKIDPVESARENPSEAAQVLNEPALVQCTEGSALHLPPALIAFWPPGPADLSGLAAPGPVPWPALSESPRDPFRDPPRQVPRSLSRLA